MVQSKQEQRGARVRGNTSERKEKEKEEGGRRRKREEGERVKGGEEKRKVAPRVQSKQGQGEEGG